MQAGFAVWDLSSKGETTGGSWQGMTKPPGRHQLTRHCCGRMINLNLFVTAFGLTLGRLPKRGWDSEGIPVRNQPVLSRMHLRLGYNLWQYGVSNPVINQAATALPNGTR
jgi:hypothetical protein